MRLRLTRVCWQSSSSFCKQRAVHLLFSSTNALGPLIMILAAAQILGSEMLKRNCRYNWLTCHGSRTGYFQSGCWKVPGSWLPCFICVLLSVVTLQSVLHTYKGVLKMSKMRINLTFGGQTGMKQARIRTYIKNVWVDMGQMFLVFLGGFFCHWEAKEWTARHRTFVWEKFSWLSYFKDCLNINTSIDICLVSSKICLPRI